MPNTPLHLLCAGAAQGLVTALQAEFERTHGASISARFGAVGAMREALEAGAPCDVLITTDAMVDALRASGVLVTPSLVDPGTLAAGGDADRAALGHVLTGVAVRAGDAQPDVASPEALRAALLQASAIYFPDPQRATAGIHFAGVLRALGVFESLQSRFSTHPNGATAMRAMAASATPGGLGCTQVSEILFTPGVVLLGALPQAFELATLYTAALSAHAAQPVLARQFAAALTSPAHAALRAQAGFCAISA